MSTMRRTIALFLKRMLAYIVLISGLGVTASKLRLPGEDTYLLNSLLAVAIVAIAEYRAARAESLLELTTRPLPAHEKPQREVPPRRTDTARPHSQSYRSEAPLKDLSTAPAPRRLARLPALLKHFRFSTSFTLRLVGGALFILAIAFLGGLIFFWGWR